MRVPLIVVLLAAVAAAGSGCTTTAEKFAAIGEDDGGSGGGTDGDGADGDAGDGDAGDGDAGEGDAGDGGGDTAGPKPTPLTTGDAAFAFNSNSSEPGNDQLVDLRVDGDQAMVLVDPKNPDMEWPEPVVMDRYRNDNQASHSLGGSYREFRSIVRGKTDAELQLWNFDHSHAAQYRVWEGGNTNASNNLVVFYGGDKTPPADMPTDITATYKGAFGATATAANWESFKRSVPDPIANSSESTYSVNEEGDVTAEIVNPNGEWRVIGNSELTANFGDGEITGDVSDMYWFKHEPDPDKLKSSSEGYISVSDAEERHPFPRQYQLEGKIEGAEYSGRVKAENDAFVPGANAFKGSFFGPSADETTGIMHHQGTWPNPNDGESPYERRERGYVDIRGFFHGVKQPAGK